MVFNTYGHTPSQKASNLQGGELVEENLYVTNAGAEKDNDNESMQSIQLVFGDGVESPDVVENAEVEGDGGDKGSTGSGMEVKIDLLAHEEQKDTALWPLTFLVIVVYEHNYVD